jgi:hypothetical protein
VTGFWPESDRSSSAWRNPGSALDQPSAAAREAIDVEGLACRELQIKILVNELKTVSNPSLGDWHSFSSCYTQPSRVLHLVVNLTIRLHQGMNFLHVKVIAQSQFPTIHLSKLDTHHK